MTITVYIAKNVYGGDGLGRLGDGRVVFVSGAWAGEEVKAEIFEERKHYVKARLVEVVEPCADRRAPDAPCVPGMVYSGLDPAAERRAKDEQLRDFFARARIAVPAFAGADDGAPIRNYRNKAVYHFARQGGQWVLGYRKEPSHEIVDITEDPLAAKPVNDALGEIRKSVFALLTQGAPAVRRDVERKGNVTVRWSFRTGVKWWIGDAPKDVALKEDTCGRIFEVPADGFYQVNPAVGESLVRHVVDAYAAGAASAPNVLDLYCGVGVFGVSCLASGRAPEGARLIGVESGRQAIEFAKRNAAAAHVEGRFFAEEVGANVRRIPLGKRTTVIVDPPRGGLEPNVPAWLARGGAARIVYVSCDPATLMRDLATICRAYNVESVRRFAMFPRTARFETCVVLTRKKTEQKRDHEQRTDSDFTD